MAQFTWSAQHALGGGAAWIVKFALTRVARPLGHRDIGDVTAGPAPRPPARAAQHQQTRGDRGAEGTLDRTAGRAERADVRTGGSGGGGRHGSDIGRRQSRLDTRSGHSACLRGGACAAREGGSGDLASEPTPLLLRQPTPHAVALPVLQARARHSVRIIAGAAERERRSRLLLGDREEDVGVDPVARADRSCQTSGGEGLSGSAPTSNVGRRSIRTVPLLPSGSPRVPGPKE